MNVVAERRRLELELEPGGGCDRCPAPALHRYRSEETGLALELCGHHSNLYAPELDLGWRIVAVRSIA